MKRKKVWISIETERRHAVNKMKGQTVRKWKPYKQNNWIKHQWASLQTLHENKTYVTNTICYIKYIKRKTNKTTDKHHS